MNITILFFSTNRLEYLMPTLESFHSKIDFTGFNLNKIFIDDYPKGRNNSVFHEIKKHYNINELILHKENLGQSETWKEAWRVIPDDTDYIWHQEDDFIFPNKINVKELVYLIENFPLRPAQRLSQICLKRQVWYADGKDFISKIESGELGDEINVEFNGSKKNLILHQHYFNANPCIYPSWVTKEKYSHNPQESVIANDLKNKYGNGVYSAIYGKRNDPPLSIHTGYYNQGKKVNKNEPGWDWLKDYDPNKKYYSQNYLKLFNHER